MFAEPSITARPVGDLDHRVRELPARQQPEWDDDPRLAAVRAELAANPELVAPGEIDALRGLLADVVTGGGLILQAGDCAENPAECTPEFVRRKVGLIETLAGIMRATTGLPVMRVGRIAGQFAKPRSNRTQRVGDLVLPVYRGPMINDLAPDIVARRADPSRMLTCYRTAAAVLEQLREQHEARIAPRVWTSHEALVLDYEIPQTRGTDDGRTMLTSAHWPWIGLRTQHPDGAHVALLAAVDNPVGCKVGPDTTVPDVLELCERLDPYLEPGRLTLISRMGADRVADRLPALVSAVRRASHPVIWLCDPMHANTVLSSCGRKTRRVDTVIREVRAFQRAVREAGGVAAGLHLEVTPEPVAECRWHENDSLDASERTYTTLCDPRLNTRQAVEVALAWQA
jgi:3-deoxy-7-phosphoheptulonate synthase